MKLILLLVLILLTGCTNPKLDIIEVHRNQSVTRFNDGAVNFGIADHGLYYITNDELFYVENNNKVISLGSVNFMNGQKVDINSNEINSTSQMYQLIGEEVICYGNRLYMLYYSDRHYQLASLNSKGEDYRIHLVLDNEPQKFFINNGKIYLYYTDFYANQDYIEIYNRNFKLIETKIYDGASTMVNFYIENDEIVIPDDFVIYENDDMKISYAIENIDSDTNRKVISKIQIDDNVCAFENKLILYANDEYFYTSSCTYPQTYERYYLNGELDQSIIISEHINSVFNVKHLFEMDFSYILRLKDKDIAYGHSGSLIFEVNFDEGTCHYLGL